MHLEFGGLPANAEGRHAGAGEKYKT